MAIPRLEGKCIENCPKIYGIATPVCALVRNDVLLFSALNNNLPFQQKAGHAVGHSLLIFLFLKEFHAQCRQFPQQEAAGHQNDQTAQPQQ